MRRSDYIALARAEAAKLLAPADYTELINCINSKSPVFFQYTDEADATKKYRGVTPIEFFITPRFPSVPGRVYLWAFHALDNHKHSFYAHTIKDVGFIPGLIDALIDLSEYPDFWNGDVFLPEEPSLFGGLLEDIEKHTDIAGKNSVVLDWLRKNLPASTTTIGGPGTTIEHEAYEMNIGGIKLYFDDVNDAVVTAVREILTGNPLPAILKKHVTAIQIVSEYKKDDPLLIAWMLDGLMTVYGDREIDTGMIAHEAAHEFSYTNWEWGMPIEGSDYLAAINSGEPPVTEYSKRNTGEDFAEAVRMFVDDPEGLQKVAPRRYGVIQRLMTSKEYGG